MLKSAKADFNALLNDLYLTYIRLMLLYIYIKIKVKVLSPNKKSLDMINSIYGES